MPGNPAHLVSMHLNGAEHGIVRYWSGSPLEKGRQALEVGWAIDVSHLDIQAKIDDQYRAMATFAIGQLLYKDW